MYLAILKNFQWKVTIWLNFMDIALFQYYSCTCKVRVSNWKSESMQNWSISVFSVRPTLGKIETTPQIGDTLEKVCENTILNHKCKYQERYVTKIIM